MYKPLISVMIPAYNAENYIAETFESLLAQTYGDFEVIIVDDSSLDNTYEIAAEYQKKDKRFKLQQNGENLGNGLSRKKALVYSTGEYVAFLDSDDRWLPEKLSRFVGKISLRKDKPLCIHSNAAIITMDGEKTGDNFQQLINTSGYPLEGELFDYFLLDNWINMPSSMVEREALINAGGFRDLYNMVDWDMWIRYSRNAEFVYIDEELTEYRIHENGISAANKARRIAESREEVFRNSLDLYQSELSAEMLSRIYYLRGANKSVLGEAVAAREDFLKAWKYNRLNVKAGVRAVLGR